MSSTWVVNASPVIILAKIGQLHLLEALANPLLLPVAVAKELLAGPAEDSARAAVARGWGQQCLPKQIPEEIVEWGLGAGESAVLALCLEYESATAVLDDAGARTAARALGVPLIGILGVVVRARLRGLLPSAAAVIADLRAAGLYLDDTVIRTALKRIGE